MAKLRNTLTILGCGTSTGVPLITCQCSVCRSRHPRNKRLRASAWVQIQGKSLLIDTSPDLRQQALKNRIPRLDAILYTHPHADHTHGIDDIRSYNFSQNAAIPAFGNEWTVRELRAKFPYIFQSGPSEGGGLPQMQLHQFDANVPQLDIVGIPVTPISLHHGSKESVGYRIKSVAYITDCSLIPSASLDRLTGLSVLVLDCLRLSPHGTHFNLDQALQTLEQVRPKKAYLTHLSHEFDYPKWSKRLPKGVALAYDGLRIPIN